MASLLNKLKDRQAVLLMHLAGELPGEDRARVELLLATDPALRSELDSLRQLQQSVTGYLNAAEAASASAPGDEAAVRRVLREMRRHQVEQLARPRPASAPRVRRWPAWSYGLASAAAAIIVLIGLWGLGVFDKKVDPGAALVETDPQPNTELAFHPSIFRAPGADPLENVLLDTIELTESNDEDPLLLMF